MRTNLNRRIAAAAIVPLLAFGLSACNDDDKDATSSDTPSQTTEGTETDAADPATPDSAGSETDAPVGAVDIGEFTTLVSDGLESSTTAKIAMDMTAGGMVTSAAGEIDYTGKQPATSLKMTIPGGQGEMEMVMVDGAMYMTLPIPGQEGWFKLDLSDAGALGDQFSGLGGLDLRDTMKSFTEGVESVEALGTEDVDGVSATHYRVTADTKAMAGMLGEQAQGVEIPESLVYDVWLDDEGRFTKMTADLDASGKIELRVTDWGVPVDIKAPPADQVQDFPTSALAG